MSLDMAINHGKEKRKKYYGEKSVDSTCRNNGSCDFCKGNRQHKNKKREMAAEELLKDYEYNIYEERN